jgi:DNA-binding NarL/FixJ family response regulator
LDTIRDQPSPIRVLLADANAAAVVGLRHSLPEEEFAVVAEVADADAAVESALVERPDLCVLDADMPGDPIRATARITRELPETAVVLLADKSGTDPMLAAVKAGASGYLFKDMDPERLRFALKGVLLGEAALPRVLVSRLMDEFRARERGRAVRNSQGRPVDLTSREWDVLELLASGGSTRECAATLGISEVTARRHISSAVTKLGTSDRNAALALLRRARES